MARFLLLVLCALAGALVVSCNTYLPPVEECEYIAEGDDLRFQSVSAMSVENDKTWLEKYARPGIVAIVALTIFGFTTYFAWGIVTGRNSSMRNDIYAAIVMFIVIFACLAGLIAVKIVSPPHYEPVSALSVRQSADEGYSVRWRTPLPAVRARVKVSHYDLMICHSESSCSQLQQLDFKTCGAHIPKEIWADHQGMAVRASYGMDASSEWIYYAVPSDG